MECTEWSGTASRWCRCEVAVTWIWQGLVSVYLEAIFILASERIKMSSPLADRAELLMLQRAQLPIRTKSDCSHQWESEAAIALSRIMHWHLAG